MRISKSTKTSVTASKSSKKFTGKGWKDFIKNIESAGYTIDSVYRNKPEKWIEVTDADGNTYDAEVTKYSDGTYELMESNISKHINSCGDIKAFTSTDKALQHIKAAIDILGKSGNKDAVTKDSIANLGVVMFDLKSKK